MKKQIVVIEDNEQNLYLVTFILEKYGYEVHAARNGREGIGLSAAVRPDLILLDIQLPVMDGYAVMDVITDKPVLNIPGCPMNPVNLTATVVHYLTFGALPEMDSLHRPLFAFGQLIHNNCERRGHFDRGEFVRAWGDAGHRAGWCLYQMGCKGPITYQNGPIVRYNDGTNWPIGAGHPCIGCAEPDFWDKPTYEPIQLDAFTPPLTYPSVSAPTDGITAEGAAVTGGAVGVVAGAALAFGYMIMTKRSEHLAPKVSNEEPSEDAGPHPE